MAFNIRKKDKKDAGKSVNFRRQIGKKMPGKNKNVPTFLNEASLLLRFFH